MRASDFESWFYPPAQIVPPPPNLAGLDVISTVVRAKETILVTIALDRSAPVGGPPPSLLRRPCFRERTPFHR